MQTITKLEEFDPSMLILESSNFNIASYFGITEFVRPIKIDARIPNFAEIGSWAYDFADNKLAEVANFVGATVVPHQWGIVKSSTVPKSFDQNFYYQPEGIPEGYVFAAKVETIQSVTRPKEALSEEELGDMLDELVRRKRGEVVAHDAYSGEYQFTYGRTASMDPPGWILHDIDMIIGVDTY